MLILGIDTSGKQGSVALLQAQGDELTTLDFAPLSGGQYSELLVPTIAGMLTNRGFQRSDIGLIGVASGPGSFTGLRIAMATVKGLAEAFDTAVVAVSVLEAIALASGAEGKVIAALDAQRSEVFSGQYILAPEQFAKLICESLAGFGDFVSGLAADERPSKIYTPDAGLLDRLRQAGVRAEVLERPSAVAFARIAHGKFLAGVRNDVATLDANYLRRSDAEILIAPGIAPA